MLTDLYTQLTTYGLKILYGLIVLIVGLQIIRFFERRVKRRISLDKVDPSLNSFIGSAMKIGFRILLFVIVASVMGIETSSIVAVLGASSLAVGLALQGSLSNFAGGVLILLLKPFKVGDFIEIASHKGTVTDITIFYTHLRTPDNKNVVIPNSSASNGSLINYSAYDTRRVDFTFGVGYNSDIKEVKEIINKVIAHNPLILKDPAPFIGLQNHGDSSLDFTVRVWANSSDYLTVYYAMMEDIKIAFDEANIEIPYPHCDVTVINK